MRTLAGGTSSGAGVMATTVWRPRVRIEVPNVDDAEGEVEVPEEVNKGVKRKRAEPLQQRGHASTG